MDWPGLHGPGGRGATGYLFAYGSLLPGERNHGVLAGRVVWSRPATARGQLVHLPEGYPALLPGDGECAGDLMAVAGLDDLWPALDRLEGVTAPPTSADPYVRREVPVRCEGRTIPAWCYVVAPEVAAAVRRRGIPVQGRWPAWLARAGAADERGPLPDILAPGLLAVFVGFNPGVRSAAAGHHYAGRANRFWELLHAARLTPRLLSPEEDHELLRHGLGSTNLVARATPGAAELRAAELRGGALSVRLKLAHHRPLAACYVGKGVYRAMRGLSGPVRYGLQPEALVEGVADFCLPNPSGRAAIPFADKLGPYRDLAAWIAQFVGPRPGGRRGRRSSET